MFSLFKQPTRVLVTDAGGSAAYNFIRSLRENRNGENLEIIGTDRSRYHIELSPLDRRYLLPGVADPGFLEALNDLIAREKIDFLHPQADVTVRFLSEHREKVRAKMFLPSRATLELCQDKMQTTEHLRRHGIAIPDACFLEGESDLEKIAGLLKRHEKVWLRAIRGAGARAALPIKTVDQARMWIGYWKEMKGVGYGDFMASEFLPGAEYAFQSLWKGGELLVSQARERLEYIFGYLTPSGQSSSPSVARTVHNEEVNKTAFAAVRGIDPKADGVFCVDLKTDAQGKVKLTEINAGRFFTTSYFFTAAGCNMPYTYLKVGLGGKPENGLKPFNNIPENQYWVRMVDMGFKLVRDQEWSSRR